MLGPRKWWVLRALGRNPLVRRADRVEAVTVILAMLATVLVIPLAMAIGESVYSSQRDAAKVAAQTHHPYQATAVSNSMPSVEDPMLRFVNVEWTAAGARQTAMVRPAQPVKAGDKVEIWVDERGHRVPAPPTVATAGAFGVGAAFVVWLGVVVACVIAFAATRTLMNRRRALAWSTELHALLDSGDGRTSWPL